MTGRGIKTWPGKLSYEGDFLRGKFHGQGILKTLTTGRMQKGKWSHGKPVDVTVLDLSGQPQSKLGAGITLDLTSTD